MNGGTLITFSCWFTLNKADIGGVAHASGGGAVKMWDTNATENYAVGSSSTVGSGGVITLNGAETTLTVIGGRFTSNQVNAEETFFHTKQYIQGGAVFCNFCKSMLFDGSLIEKNSAVHHNLSHPANSYYVLGGGIAINSYAKALMCNFTMRNSRIVGNHAARGGAIDINGGTGGVMEVHVQDTFIGSNSAAGRYGHPEVMHDWLVPYDSRWDKTR